MMRIISFSILLIMSCSTSVLGQKSDTIRAVITYAFSHLRDLNDSKPYTENMDLFLGASSSWYKSGDKAKSDSIMMANFEASGFKEMTAIPAIVEEIFLDFADQKILIKDRFFDDYLLADEWPAIDWQISGETRIISGMNCQQATGEWRGRTYIAWFSSELPYRAGPWKLNGLPGLIIEAHDVDKSILFNFAGFRTIPEGKDNIQFPTKGIKTTATEFRKMKEAARQNMMGSINAMTGKNTIVSEDKVPRKPKSGTGNPMELLD